MAVDEAIRKADVLIEAMGWIRRFRGREVVIKLGGSALEDPQTVRNLLTDVTGNTPKWYWPPFLEVDDRIRAAAAKTNLEVYSTKQVVVSQDYDRSVSAAEIKRKATTNVKDGSVILFHEWRDETYEQLPAILAELRRQGCTFLTFTELAAYNQSKK